MKKLIVFLSALGLSTLTIVLILWVTSPKQKPPQRNLKNETQLELNKISKALYYFYNDCGYYPKNEGGLGELLENYSGCANWGPEPYLNEIPKDPWNRDFIYEQIDQKNYRLKSLGADGIEGGAGLNEDIVNEN